MPSAENQPSHQDIPIPLPEYYYINPESLFLNRSGRHEDVFTGRTIIKCQPKNEQTNGVRKITNISCYALAYAFISKPFECHIFQDQLKNFCFTLVALFNSTADGEKGSPLMIEEGYNERLEMTFKFENPPSINQQKTFHNVLAERLLDDDHFLRQRQEYILCPREQNLIRSNKILEQFSKTKEGSEFTGTPVITLCNIPAAKDKDGLLVKEGSLGSIIIPGYEFEKLEDVCEEAINDTIKDSFDEPEDAAFRKLRNVKLPAYKNMPYEYHGEYDEMPYQYIAKHIYSNNSLQEQYDLQRQKETPKLRKMILLSSILAYQAKNVQQLQLMIAEKTAHIRRLAHIVYDKHLVNTPPELILSHQSISIDILSMCNEYVLNIMTKIYANPEKRIKPKRKGNKYVYMYSKMRNKILEDRFNNENEEDMLEEIDEADQELLKRFDTNPEKNKRLAPWVVDVLCKDNADDILLLDAENIHQKPMIRIPDNQLKEYIEAQEIGINKCAAIRVYLLRSNTLLSFAERLSSYALELDKYYQRVSRVEESLQDIYSFAKFYSPYCFLEDKLLREIIQSSFGDIEQVMAYLCDIEISPQDEYFPQYEFYQSIYILLMKAHNGDAMSPVDLHPIGESFRGLVAEQVQEDQGSTDNEPEALD